MKNKTNEMEFCPSCGKEVPVTKGAGLLTSLWGFVMFLAGLIPGKRQSQGPICKNCGTELIEG